jgi:hypothetical protein
LFATRGRLAPGARAVPRMPTVAARFTGNANQGAREDDDAHGFVCLAVNRKSSKAESTIQPTGYGNTPVKKASRVAISKTVNSSVIQSNLIVALLEEETGDIILASRR